MSQHDTQEIEKLRKIIQHHDHLYYALDQPEISDREYDRLMEKLKAREARHPESVTPDSPTQRVAGKASEKFESVRHKTPMLSLDNTYNIEEVRDFHNRVVKNLGTDQVEYVVELKFDGLGVTLTYENGKFVQGATRGDGKTGVQIQFPSVSRPRIPSVVRMWKLVSARKSQLSEMRNPSSSHGVSRLHRP